MVVGIVVSARLGGFWGRCGTNIPIRFLMANAYSMNWSSNFLDLAMGYTSNLAFDFKCFLYALLQNSLGYCDALVLLQFHYVHFLDLLVVKGVVICLWFSNFYLLRVCWFLFSGFLINGYGYF
jgi:hypothetical protein